MKSEVVGCLLVAGLAAGCCRNYVYQVTPPAGAPLTIAERPVNFNYDPLQYMLLRADGRLAVCVVNPTTDRVRLLGDRSYVTDPGGEQHPLPSRAIGPHGSTLFLLPPEPESRPIYGWGGWGWGYDSQWSPHYSVLDPFYNESFHYWPPISYERVLSPLDWDWQTGPARLHLTYDRAGNVFNQEIELVRQVAR